MTKLLTWLTIALGAFLLCPSFAAPDDTCRTLPTVEERNSCHVKNAISELPKQPPKSTEAKRIEPAMPDRVDELTTENDRVKSRLKGICRGC